MPSMMRRMRTRLPTYLSTGLGALVDISSTPWDYALEARQRKNGVCPRRQNRQILLVGEECRQIQQRTDRVWSRRARQNANCTAGLSTGGLRLADIFADSRKRHCMPASGTPFRNAPPKHENQGGDNDDRGGNVAAACINRRRNR